MKNNHFDIPSFVFFEGLKSIYIVWITTLDFTGLMITGFAKAGQALQDESYIQRAITAANFVKKHLYNPTAETLLRSCYRGTDGNTSQMWVLQLCIFNPLNPELNPICYLLALLGARHFLHVSRIRVKLLTLRWLMSYIYIYIYGAPILDVSRSHTMTQHTR